MDIRDVNDFNNYYLDDDDWGLELVKLEASDDEIRESVVAFVDYNYDEGTFSPEDIDAFCEEVKKQISYGVDKDYSLVDVVREVVEGEIVSRRNAEEAGYDYDDDDMPQLIPYEDDEDDFGESLEATVDQDLEDSRQPAMDVGEKEMDKPVSAADMIKDRFGIKESKELIETSTSGEPLPIEMPASTGKLSSDKDAKWSTWQVKDAFDFGAILDQIKDKLQAISREGGLCYGFMFVINIDNPRAKIDEQEILGSEDECAEFCMNYIKEHKDQIEQIEGGIFYVEEFDDIYNAEDIDLKRYIELSQQIKANTWTYDNLDVGDWSVWINAADENTKPDIGGNSGYTSDIANLYQELGCEIQEW